MTIKVITVLGARPQFVKAAVVSKALRENPFFEEFVIHTGQHYDYNMSELFFSELEMTKPQIDLGIGSGSHGQQTGQMLVGIEKILVGERPDWVLVYGDTNSTLAGAIAAAKLHIPVAHVEAGLRSFNRRMPEEINRIITDQISELLFAPTSTACFNLQREGVPSERIENVGDVMFDVVKVFGPKAAANSNILNDLGVTSKKYILATIHRAENTEDIDRMKTIVDGLNIVSRTLPVIWPLHPRTRKLLQIEANQNLFEGRVHVIEPVGYLDMVNLERNAAIIATDSGGVQKEAYFHQVPCVTLREETEWVELVEHGWNRILPPNNSSKMASVILSSIGQRGDEEQFYGDGKAAQKIVQKIADRSTSP